MDPIVVSPFDAELFGHWWFEGPEFLNLFIRKSVYDQHDFQLTTPGKYLENHTTLQILVPSASSWGHKGYWEVWLDESNAWIYPHLHAAARRMTEIARHYNTTATPFQERVLKQLARELLLAQSSDWAFLMKTGTAKNYATKRTRDHLLRFTRLYDQLRCNDVDEEFLKNCEWRDNLFPNLNWRYYV
jgi:1,4-alpha-glucan branching enzyme